MNLSRKPTVDAAVPWEDVGSARLAGLEGSLPS
jgi:hypothetical protein